MALFDLNEDSPLGKKKKKTLFTLDGFDDSHTKNEIALREQQAYNQQKNKENQEFERIGSQNVRNPTPQEITSSMAIGNQNDIRNKIEAQLGGTYIPGTVARLSSTLEALPFGEKILNNYLDKSPKVGNVSMRDVVDYSKEKHQYQSMAGTALGAIPTFMQAGAITPSLGITNKVGKFLATEAITGGLGGFARSVTNKTSTDKPYYGLDEVGKETATEAIMGPVFGAGLKGAGKVIGKAGGNAIGNAIGKGVGKVVSKIPAVKNYRINQALKPVRQGLDSIDDVYAKLKAKGIGNSDAAKVALPDRYAMSNGLNSINKNIKTQSTFSNGIKESFINQQDELLPQRITPEGNPVQSRGITEPFNTDQPIKRISQYNDMPTQGKPNTQATTQAMEATTPIKATKPTDTLSSMQKSKLEALKQKYDSDIKITRNDRVMDSQMKGKQLKGLGERYADKVREITQGDSLLPVEGGLTPNALAKKITRLRTNYAGKELMTPDGAGISIGKTSNGKVGVKMPDGTTKWYASDSVTGKVDVDALIAQQKATQVKPIPREIPPQITEPPISTPFVESNINSPSSNGNAIQGNTEPSFKIQNEPSFRQPNEPNFPQQRVSQRVSEPMPTDNSPINRVTDNAPYNNIPDDFSSNGNRNVFDNNPANNVQNNTPNPQMVESQIKTNTVNKFPEIDSPDGQKFYKDIEATFEVKTDKLSIERANKMLETDYNGTYKRLSEQGINGKEDNLAAFQIARDLMADKQWDMADEFMAKIIPEGRSSAQIVQSYSTVAKDSLEGVAINAKKLIDARANEILANSPSLSQSLKDITNVVDKNIKMIPFNLQLFGETIDKQLKQAMGKLYKKEYVKSILDVIESGKYSKETITNAIKQKLGVPTFNGSDLEKIANLHAKLKGVNKDTWDYRAIMDQIDQVTQSKLPATTANKLSTHQFMSLYSNTLTPLKIAYGNVSGVATDHAKDILTYVIEKVMTGGKSNVALPSLKTKYKGLMKGIKEVNLDRKFNVNTDPFSHSYDIKMKSGLTFNSKLIRPLEKYVKYFMSIVERPAKQAIFDDKLRMLMKEANVANPTQNMIGEAVETAIEQANYVAFANSTKATNLANTLRGGLNEITNTPFNKIFDSVIGKKITGSKLGVKMNLEGLKVPENQLRDFGIGNLVQPIMKTPLNMLKMAGDYSGLTLPFAKSKREIAERTAKAIIGLGGFAGGLGYHGKKSGLISGGLPTDKDARDFGIESGRQPYALNAFGKSYNLDNIQPVGMLASFGAELASENSKKEPIVAALDSMLNNRMMQGFAKMLGATALGRGSLSENILDAVTGGFSTMIPMGGAFNQAGKSIDPYKRDTSDDDILKRNLVNRVIQRTPLRLGLPIKISSTGEKVKEDDAFDTFVGFYGAKTLKNDDVTNELNRLYDQANETKQFPSTPKNTITYKPSKKAESQKLELTPAQLSQYKETLGKANMEAIAKTIRLGSYKKANDKEKAGLISKAMADNKQTVENKTLKLFDIREYKASKNLSRGRTSR